MNEFVRPDWVPKVRDGSRILVTGASGGIGRCLVDMLVAGSDCIVGAHGTNKDNLPVGRGIIPIIRRFDDEADCIAAVDSFIAEAGGIDALVVLSGGLHFSGHWKDMPSHLWQRDIDLNISQPFYLARRALLAMREQQSGGRVLLTGTESAIHGGSAASFPYAIAKRGTECMVQGLAREGAPDGILVNGLRLGYIKSGFHQRWHARTDEEMQQRAELVPLKRGGDVAEAAALMIYLMSDWASFITGQMIPLTGGDWL